jgi:hypothetical protein
MCLSTVVGYVVRACLRWFRTDGVCLCSLSRTCALTSSRKSLGLTSFLLRACDILRRRIKAVNQHEQLAMRDSLLLNQVSRCGTHASVRCLPAACCVLLMLWYAAVAIVMLAVNLELRGLFSVVLLCAGRSGRVSRCLFCEILHSTPCGTGRLSGNSQSHYTERAIH